jgi:hypothetical protein
MSEVDRLKRELTKQKMAVVVSKAEVIFSGAVGESKEVKWIV